MAEDKQVQPRAIQAKDVADRDTWRKICEIAGSGYVPRNPDGSTAIDVTGLSDAKLARIDKLMGTEEPQPASAEQPQDTNKTKNARK